jgi:hypothetical protein
MYHIRFKKRVKLCKHYYGMKGDDSSAYMEVKTEAKVTREGLKKKRLHWLANNKNDKINGTCIHTALATKGYQHSAD